MATTSDRDRFFQSSKALSDTARRERKAKNKNGNPIALKSKGLAVLLDSRHSSNSESVFVAESGGVVTQVDTNSGQTTRTFSGPQAPLTSLVQSNDEETLFAGCWDKSVWQWDLSQSKGTKVSTDHDDFIKSLLHFSVPISTLNGPIPRGADLPAWPESYDILITGGSDASFGLLCPQYGWQHIVKTSSFHGPPLPARGILALAVDPASINIAPTSGSPEKKILSMVLFTSSSDPYIRRWKLCFSLTLPSTNRSPDASPEAVQPGFHFFSATSYGPVIHVHETSVNALYFYPPAQLAPLQLLNAQGPNTEDAELRRELWTASSDGTAKRLFPRLPQPTPSNTQNFQDSHPEFNRLEDEGAEEWTPTLTLVHNDYVRTILVSTAGDYIITGGRDENVKIWDRPSDTDGTSIKHETVTNQVHTYAGHFEEITAACLLPSRGTASERIVTVGIDMTLRAWDLDEAAFERDRVAQETRLALLEEYGGNEDALDAALEERSKEGALQEEKAQEGGKTSLLTDEEEKELAELMAEES